VRGSPSPAPDPSPPASPIAVSTYAFGATGRLDWLLRVVRPDITDSFRTVASGVAAVVAVQAVLVAWVVSAATEGPAPPVVAAEGKKER